MKKNNSEAKLRKAAKDQMDVPPTFIWDNIEEELHPKESKRRIGFWWLGSGVLVATIIVSFLYIGKNKDDSAINPVASHIDMEKVSLSDEINKEENERKFNKENVAITSLIEKENSTFKSSHTVVTVKDETHASEVNKIKYSISKKTIASDKKNTQEFSLKIENSYSSTLVTNQDVQKEILLTNKQDRINYNIVFISSLDLKSVNYSRQLLPSQRTPKPTNEIRFHPYVEFGIIGGSHNINLSKGQNENLFNLRSESESAWYSTGIYSTFGLRLYDNWHVSVGTEWTMSKDKFENTSDGITKMIVTSDPSSGTAIDTNFISGSVLDKGDITLHFIDIPLSIGYTVSKNKWLFGAEITGLLNIKTTAEGKLLDNSETGIIANGQKSIYKKSVGIGFKSSLLLGRKINDSYSLQLRPSYKTYMNTINESNYVLPTRYNLFSLSVGLRRQF